MSMVCPQCKSVYEQQWLCPECDVRLDYRGISGASRVVRVTWKRKPWLRMVVGVALVQGLYYGAGALWKANLHALVDELFRGASATLTKLVLNQGLQAIGVFIVAMVVGAAQRQGFLYSALTGLVNGVLFVAAQIASGKQLTEMELFGQPFLLAVVGALGGLGGMLLSKPARFQLRRDPQSADQPVAQPDAQLGAPPREGTPKSSSPFAGPVAWSRVLLGILVAVSGTVLASVTLKWVLDLSRGELTIASHLQSQVVTCEICVLMMLAGSGLAGATTRNGMKQGMIVGLCSGLLLAGVSLASTHTALKIFTFSVSSGGSDTLSLLNVFLTIASSASLGLVGGWFGGDMLPPVVPRHWKRFRSKEW